MIAVLAVGLDRRRLLSCWRVAGHSPSSSIVTREAEGAEVWRTYFTAEDCLLDALTEDPEAISAAIERLARPNVPLWPVTSMSH